MSGRTRPSRAAWCYGDPGIAMALMSAATALRSRSLRDRALQVARGAAQRSFTDAGVVDAGLCHGASGLALIFAELFHATGEQAFRDAAGRWLRVTLTMARGDGTFESSEHVTGPDETFLTGACGVALALTACVERRRPRWARRILMELGPR